MGRIGEMFFKWKRLGRSGKGTTILNSLQELDPRNPDARIQRVLSSEPAAYARYCVFFAALPICKCSRRLAWTVAHLDSLSERMTKRFESQVRLELEWHKVHAMQWQGMVSNLCSFHISICNLRSIRMDGSKNTRSWIFWIPPTIRSFVIGKSRPVHELVLLILSQDGEDTSKDWICLRSKANGEPYLDLVTGWEEYGHSPSSWCLHMVASWDLKKSNSENNVENWEYPKYLCTYTVLLFWLTCHGYSSHFLLVHRCKCEDLLLSRVLPTWLMQVLGFLHSGAVNATSHATRSASDAVDCVKATHPWCLAREVCWSWLTDISEIAMIHKIHRGTNKCIEVPLQ